MYFTGNVKLPKWVKFVCIDTDGDIWGFEFKPSFEKIYNNKGYAWYNQYNKPSGNGKWELLASLKIKITKYQSEKSLEEV